MNEAMMPAQPADMDPHPGEIEREAPTAQLRLGQWVMVADEEKRWNKEREDYDRTPYEWLGCVVGIGSNFAEVAYPAAAGRSFGTTRIHFDEIWTRLRFLADVEAEAKIAGKVAHYQERSASLIGQVKEITQRLGLRSAGALTDKSPATGTALATLSSQADIDGYKGALIKAQNETLPALFKQIKEANEELGRWMTASTLPLQAMSGDLDSHIGEIKDRVFNISLYAGLVESVVQVRDGERAAPSERLHVMQRCCYMDEECLANYRTGGMSFKDIGKFDAWLSEPDNLTRILPFPRTIVAMQVRRREANREWDGSLMGAYINFHLAQADKFTFLYIRNGEQLWRLSTELDFGNMIFPDRAIYDPAEPLMIRMFAGNVQEMMTRSEYESRNAEWEACDRKHRAWCNENPLEAWQATNPGQDSWHWERASPYYLQRSRLGFKPQDWTPLDFSNIYFDDAMAKIGDEIKRYNRIATIIQGLFDRSDVLHPHPPVKAWTPEGFDQAIKLVYDASQVLHSGEAPDFEAYRAQCNASIGVGSWVVGQDIYWLEEEAKKEMQRRRADYRLSEGERYRELKRYRPHGNPGPAVVTQLDNWKPRARMGVIRWMRERREFPYDKVPCTLSVPERVLLNVSAYRPGDFKRFYQDSRTRAEYLKWAPMLLAAEEWWAKNGDTLSTEQKE